MKELTTQENLFRDIIHDAPITGEQTFQDTRDFKFVSSDGIELEVTDYYIADGKLTVYLEEREAKFSGSLPSLEPITTGVILPQTI